MNMDVDNAPGDPLTVIHGVLKDMKSTISKEIAHSRDIDMKPESDIATHRHSLENDTVNDSYAINVFTELVSVAGVAQSVVDDSIFTVLCSLGKSMEVTSDSRGKYQKSSIEYIRTMNESIVKDLSMSARRESYDRSGSSDEKSNKGLCIGHIQESHRESSTSNCDALTESKNVLHGDLIHRYSTAKVLSTVDVLVAKIASMGAQVGKSGIKQAEWKETQKVCEPASPAKMSTEIPVIARASSRKERRTSSLTSIFEAENENVELEASILTPPPLRVAASEFVSALLEPYTYESQQGIVSEILLITHENVDDESSISIPTVTRIVATEFVSSLLKPYMNTPHDVCASEVHTEEEHVYLEYESSVFKPSHSRIVATEFVSAVLEPYTRRSQEAKVSEVLGKEEKESAQLESSVLVPECTDVIHNEFISAELEICESELQESLTSNVFDEIPSKNVAHKPNVFTPRLPNFFTPENVPNSFEYGLDLLQKDSVIENPDEDVNEDAEDASSVFTSRLTSIITTEVVFLVVDACALPSKEVITTEVLVEDEDIEISKTLSEKEESTTTEKEVTQTNDVVDVNTKDNEHWSETSMMSESCEVKQKNRPLSRPTSPEPVFEPNVGECDLKLYEHPLSPLKVPTRPSPPQSPLPPIKCSREPSPISRSTTPRHSRTLLDVEVQTNISISAVETPLPSVSSPKRRTTSGNKSPSYLPQRPTSMSRRNEWDNDIQHKYPPTLLTDIKVKPRRLPALQAHRKPPSAPRMRTGYCQQCSYDGIVRKIAACDEHHSL